MSAKSFEEWWMTPDGSFNHAHHDAAHAAWFAARAAMLADRPDVADAVTAINAAVCGEFLRHADQQAIADKFTPCEPKCECAGLLRARAALESLAAQLAERDALKRHAEEVKRDLAASVVKSAELEEENSKLRSALAIVHFKREPWQ